MAEPAGRDLTPPTPRPELLRRGDEGPTVEELQIRLNEDGADPSLVVDADFGGATDTAVREFQARHGCKVDGLVGPQTWGLLDELDRADIVGPHDVMGDTHSVTTEEAAAVAETGRLNTVVQMIQAYPAEASSGTIFVQFGDPSFEGRQGRWDLLSGFMHEYLHLVAHPGYNDAAETMGGGARRVLVEGFCDYFREQAWNALRPRFSTDDDRGDESRAPPSSPRIQTRVRSCRTAPTDEIDNARLIVSALGPMRTPDRSRSVRLAGGERARGVLHGPRRAPGHRPDDNWRSGRRRGRHLDTRRCRRRRYLHRGERWRNGAAAA